MKPKKNVYSNTVNRELREVNGLNEINGLNYLTLKQKILYYTYDRELSKTNLSEHTGNTIAAISMAISRDDCSNLLSEGLLEISRIEGKIKYYTATNLGKAEVDIIAKEEERKKSKHHQEKEKNDKLHENLDNTKKFIDEYYYANLLENVRKGKNYLKIDFNELVKFDSGLAEDIIEKPEEFVKIFEIVVKEFDLPRKIKRFIVRFEKLPLSLRKNIADIRGDDINSLISLKVVPVGFSPVRPRTIKTDFECPSCGNIIPITQLGEQVVKPNRCPCGRKGDFTEKNKTSCDAQGLKVEEAIEEIGGRLNQQQLNVFLEYDLTDDKYQIPYESSEPIIINGWIKEVPLTNKRGKTINRTDYIFEANSVEFNLTKEEIVTDKEIKELKSEVEKPNFLKKLLKSFAPNVIKTDIPKLNILLSIVSGGSGSTKGRDDSHLLLVGDPGTGKSQLLLEARELISCIWVSGNDCTSAGLIGTVVHDETLGQNVLSKGVLPRANNRVVIIDEMDKMKSKDIMALHEAMENQITSMHKWNKSVEFKTDFTMIAAANPKHGRFITDDDGHLIHQINLPDAILNRFDIIVAFFDIPSERDKEICDSILTGAKTSNPDLLKPIFMIKYLKYARTFNPELNDECGKAIRTYYLNKRNSGGKILQINTRTLEGIKRLTTASAKLRLSNEATIEDFKLVKPVFEKYFETFLKNKITNTFDLGLIEGLSCDKETVLKFIPRHPGINIEDLISKLNINPTSVDSILARLSQEGSICTPRAGFVARL